MANSAETSPSNLFMEHVIKHTKTELIKRYELANKSVWIVRKEQNFGVATSKKQAEKDTKAQTLYAHVGFPDFIAELGSYDKLNNRTQVNSVPGALNFIWGQIPLSWHSKFIFRVIADQNSPRTFVEIDFASDNTFQPYRYWSDNKKGFHQQVTDCIYQFYIDMEKGTISEKKNKKLGEWEKNWYSKLTPRKMK